MTEYVDPSLDDRDDSEIIKSHLPKGWDVGDYGDTLVCPHGNEIELDGRCPQGCVSPLSEMGLI
jgi:hypothetical protein